MRKQTLTKHIQQLSEYMATDLLIIFSNSAEISSHIHCLPFMKTEKLSGNTEDENIKQYVGIKKDTKKCCQDTSGFMDATELSRKKIH